MPILPRTSSAHHVVALGTACLIALAGCDAKNSPGEDNGHQEEHAGHVIPAHKPRTFPDAVRRLRELNDQFLQQGTAAARGAPIDPKKLQFTLDIANWLPEIAADSDMPETPWNEVDTRSARLVAEYQSLISGDPVDAHHELDQANAEIANLEKLLLASQPRWFEETGKVVVAP